MIEFWNVLIAAIAGAIIGAVLHSAWLHSRERGKTVLNTLGSLGPDIEKRLDREVKSLRRSILVYKEGGKHPPERVF